MTTPPPEPTQTLFAAASVPENYERHLAPLIFEPWAQILVDTANISSGSRVLDIASGTGVAARAAARAAGPDGRVVASDVSAPMLGRASAREPPEGTAPISYEEASAVALPFADESFDVVLCQQGLQFFGDRLAAVREMRRVLATGGVAAIAVWAADRPLEPFGEYADAIADLGVEAPFPGAFDHSSFVMSDAELGSLFRQAGFSSPEVSQVEHVVTWPDAESAAVGILGTPYAPLVNALPTDMRERLQADLWQRFAPSSGDAAPTRATVAFIVRAEVAPD